MPITDILFLAGVICAFAAFAGVLAWGDYRTRSIGRPNELSFRPVAPQSRLSLVSTETVGRKDRSEKSFIAGTESAADTRTPRTSTHA